jgi:hypothetical protein
VLRFPLLSAGLLFLAASVGFAEQVSPGGPSPGAQKIIQLTKSGVDESVILAYIQAQTEPLNVTADDFTSMKSAGVSAAVMTAIVSHDSRWRDTSPRNPPQENQLYRLYFGKVFHEGLSYSASGGLPNSVTQDLESDPLARPDIVSYSGENLGSRVLGWGGFGLLLGGFLYAGIADAANPSSSYLNNTIGISAATTGILSLIIGQVLNAAAYQSLYDGLYIYNRDLVKTGGNP